MMIAMAIAASAAAIVIINMVKKMPSSFSGYRYLLNTTKFIFTLFNISSTDISMVIMLRRVNKPYMPMKNSAVLTNKIFDIGMPSINFIQRVLFLLCFLFLPVHFLQSLLWVELLSLSQYSPPWPPVTTYSLLQKAMHSHSHL